VELTLHMRSGARQRGIVCYACISAACHAFNILAGMGLVDDLTEEEQYQYVLNALAGEVESALEASN
jgi:hypothetical protein